MWDYVSRFSVPHFGLIKLMKDYLIFGRNESYFNEDTLPEIAWRNLLKSW
jgi:hypothetical protein